MPGFWFPTHDQLKNTYRSIVQGRFDDGSLKKVKPPKDIETNSARYRVGIDGMKGREMIYNHHLDLYVKNTNTKTGKSTWYDAGPAPLF